MDDEPIAVFEQKLREIIAEMKQSAKDAEDPQSLYDQLNDYFPNKIEELLDYRQDAESELNKSKNSQYILKPIKSS
jgi:hypothetical protein